MVAATEVIARWAYCELNSDRWAKKFKNTLPAAVGNLSAAGAPFEQVNGTDYPALIDAFYGARDQSFIQLVARSPAYERVQLTRDELLEVQALWSLSPTGTICRYADFLAAPPKTNADGQPDACDPREKIKSASHDSTFSQTEAGIIINSGGIRAGGITASGPMLLEGYYRSLLFVKFGSDAQRYSAWWPTELLSP